MIQVQHDTTATAPWYGARNDYNYNKHDPMGGSLRYRGWTLVDSCGWRYAARGTERLRVCREGTDRARALRLFRARVDEAEAA